jgi:DNA processing protein
VGGVTDAGPELIGTWSAGVEPEDDELALARALLSRLAEPACIPLWGYVRDEGPVEAVRKIRAGTAPADVMRATAARLPAADPEADLAAAQHHGIRLVYPEAPEWPHFGLACLEQAGLRRLAEYRKGRTAAAEHGEPIPPLALWIRGTADLATLGVRSAGIVGARAATAYGERVAADLAFGLAARDFAVVSGGAFGIDAAAHRGALGAGGVTYLVSAGGLDTPYPPANTRLFERCAESGLLIAESPPGAAPRRRRFLTRNRLIAALSSGTVVVEASARSGAINTARHCLRLDRPLMVVPGPVTSALSAGCHDLLRQHEGLARIVTCTDDVVAHIGTLSEAPTGGTHPAAGGYGVRDRLDAVAEPARILFDSFPSRASVGLDYLVAASGLPVATVLQSLSALELAELVERSGDGYRILRRAKGRSDGRGTCSPGRAGA